MIGDRLTIFSSSTKVRKTKFDAFWLKLTMGSTLDQDIDATHAGNKTRFINNSSNDVNKNCEPALLLCNTVTRIGIYALRDINPGEELFFNYG